MNKASDSVHTESWTDSASSTSQTLIYPFKIIIYLWKKDRQQARWMDRWLEINSIITIQSQNNRQAATPLAALLHYHCLGRTSYWSTVFESYTKYPLTASMCRTGKKKKKSHTMRNCAGVWQFSAWLPVLWEHPWVSFDSWCLKLKFISRRLFHLLLWVFRRTAVQ